MNFLLRSGQTAASEQPPTPEANAGAPQASNPATTLEGLIAQVPFPESSPLEPEDRGSENGRIEDFSSKEHPKTEDSHIDVTEDEGWITIPCKVLDNSWSEAPDILSFCSLDRSFVFPGERIHILACLSASKQNIEIVTPFKVAEVMSKNGVGGSFEKQNGNNDSETDHDSEGAEVGLEAQDMSESNKESLKGKSDLEKDVSTGESLLRMEVHRRQTEKMLQQFRSSHFFVRIAESGEPLWAKGRAFEASPQFLKTTGENYVSEGAETAETIKKKVPISAAVDRGSFDASATGGLARNLTQCCSLSNGDLVVLLQVNVGTDFMRDPILEILQFEKHEDRSLKSEIQETSVNSYQDPCGELLKWLLPLENTIPSPVRNQPPPMGPSPSIRVPSTKSNLSGSSGSQLFSFRSYSMSSLPANSTQPVMNTPSRPNFDLENWDPISSQRLAKSEIRESEKLLSFRGVSLEPKRFAVRCGMEGIYVPGRRWRRKIEIVQPVEIKSFAADCNTDDLLCIQIKNVSPAYAPDIVVYLDAITIVFEEGSKGGPPLSLPIACIEAGNGYSLPNLALRRGEEHSFILKLATSMWRSTNNHAQKNVQSYSRSGGAESTLHHSNTEGKRSGSPSDQYAVLVSCRCNYTESRLFFKQPTSWRPRMPRDLMISVASEMTRQTLGSNGGVSQLPVQVLTLQASNFTSEDLTLTVLAPASFTSPPSVVSLSSSPTSPVSLFVDSSEFTGKVSSDRRGTSVQGLSQSPFASENEEQIGNGGPRSLSSDEQAVPMRDFGCTHLWLQSRVPLGCVPSQSMATIKLQVLPLTDGIITLDSLQIYVKEKGIAYIPENSLKINATSSIATGFM